MKQYVADFETTSSENFEVDKTVRVWAVNIREISKNESVLTSNNIDDFFKFIQKESSEVFFHNLKFDGQFILNELFRRGYKHKDEPKNEKEFGTLIADNGIWYSMTIIHKKFNKRYVKTTIYDSLKKLPFSADQIAKAFELPTVKGSIDYTKYRPIDYEMTDDEKYYVENDTSIISQALKIQFDSGLKKMTIGSDALNYFKCDLGQKAFKYLFPILPHSVDNDLRQAYKGGFVYLNPKFRNKEIENILCYDVNSLYPSVMYECELPFGEPVYFKGKYKQDAKRPLYICVIRANFELKDGFIPTIQLKNSFRFNPTEYVTTSNDEIVQMTMTSVDLALFLDHYNIKHIEYICGWKFRNVQGLFKSYIDYWGEIKKNSTGAKRQLAKLMLNSLYGKFGTNDRKCQAIPYLDKEDGIVKFKRGEETIEKPVYTALACFVTAWARNKTIRSAQSVGIDHFIYADTDSLKITGMTEDEVKQLIEVDQKELGKWKDEGHAEKGKFLRAKTYVLEIENKLHVTCAGMPEVVKEKVNFDNFKYGSIFSGKLLQTRVKGGVLLKDTEFTIKE